MNDLKFVQAFREAAPYIHYLRGKTLVICINGQVIAQGGLPALAADLNLLSSLGVRLVLVADAEMQLEYACRQQNIVPQRFHGRLRCDESMLNLAKQVYGALPFDFQAAFSLGFTQSPQKNPRLRLAQGNFISAKPMGVINGMDMLYTGCVRKTDAAAIHALLDQQAIVLFTPIATSLAGQTYTLSPYETAESLAVSLCAEKLIFVEAQAGIPRHHDGFFNSLTSKESQELSEKLPENNALHALLTAANRALQQGISRVQVLSGLNDGALIRELFTREGAGTSIASDSMVTVRAAQESDVVEIIRLIRPLQEQGILVHRSRDQLERQIHDFFILENDHNVCGCVARRYFNSTPNAAELACLAVAPEARAAGYGEILLNHVCKTAAADGKHHLFALSTHTADWFTERGFTPSDTDQLPIERAEEYRAAERHSKIFMLNLKEKP